MIYLDNASTTEPLKSITDNIEFIAKKYYGNPGSTHIAGKNSANIVDTARSYVAMAIGAEPDNIVFTGSATEANNMAIRGWASHLPQGSGKRYLIITSEVEHDSVRKSVEYVKSNYSDYIDVVYVGVDEYGKVDIDAIEDIVSDNDYTTGLISIMHVNNEVGAVNDIYAIQRIADKVDWSTHFDCTQSIGMEPVNVKDLDPDYITFSSHKIHGLKGTGALYIKNMETINPLIIGGHSQEYGMRGGTENVLGIWAFGEACKEIVHDPEQIMAQSVRDLYNLFCDELWKKTNGFTINGNRVGKIINLRFDGIDGETLLLLLSNVGVCISAGSACRSKLNVPSHVLTAMGLTPNECRSSIRVSFSHMNTEDEVVKAADNIATFVSILRGEHRGEGVLL